MKILHLVWAVASIGLAFLVNEVMRPDIDRASEQGDVSVGTGELVLEHQGGRIELKLVTLRPLIRDLEFPFGKVVRIREVAVISASPANDPAFFVYFDLGGDAPFAVDNREPGVLVNRTLRALPKPFGGGVTSRARLSDSTGHGEIISGALTLTEAVPLEGQAGETSVSIKGHVAVTVSTAGVKDQVQGRLSGLLVW